MPDQPSRTPAGMSTAQVPLRPAPPAGDEEVSLLRPQQEVSELRRRRERPAELGRYPLLMLGAIALAAGATLWLTSRTRIDQLAIILCAFGLTLAAIGGLLHLLLLRERDRWPEAAHAWDEGIEIVLHDHEVKAALWSDPKLAIDLFVHRPRNGPDDVRLMYWKMDGAVPPCDLSTEGFDRLMAIVVAQNLRLNELRSGPRGRESRVFEIRARGRTLDLGKMKPGPETIRTAP
jgi:hypothetical protein